MQNTHWKTIVACLPAFAAGALSPVISDLVLRIACAVSWVGCLVIFLNKDYLHRTSAHVASFIKEEYRKGVTAAVAVLWSIGLVLGVTLVVAFAAQALWGE